MAMTPYVGNYARYDDSVRVEGKMYRVNYKGADEEAYKVFRPEMVEGEWLSDNKLEDGSFTCVVTRQFVDELKWTQPLGRKLFVRGNDFTVVGVVSGIKHKVLLFAEPAVIVPYRAIKYDNINKPNVPINAKTNRNIVGTDCNIILTKVMLHVPLFANSIFIANGWASLLGIKR